MKAEPSPRCPDCDSPDKNWRTCVSNVHSRTGCGSQQTPCIVCTHPWHSQPAPVSGGAPPTEQKWLKQRDEVWAEQCKRGAGQAATPAPPQDATDPIMKAVREAFDVIDKTAQEYSLHHHDEKSFALNQQRWGALMIVQAIERARAVSERAPEPKLNTEIATNFCRSVDAIYDGPGASQPTEETAPLAEYDAERYRRMELGTCRSVIHSFRCYEPHRQTEECVKWKPVSAEPAPKEK